MNSYFALTDTPGRRRPPLFPETPLSTSVRGSPARVRAAGPGPSPTPKTSGPGVNPINTTGGFTPGCATCIHMPWAWSTAVSLVEPDFTDGRPQIEKYSEQSADFGIVRY